MSNRIEKMEVHHNEYSHREDGGASNTNLISDSADGRVFASVARHPTVDVPLCRRGQRADVRNGVMCHRMSVTQSKDLHAQHGGVALYQ